MPYDGSGNFTRDYNFTTDKNNGIKIQSVRVDGECDNFADGFNQVLLRNGIVPFSGNAKLGGNRITGLGAGTVGSPALQPTVDTTTGIYFPAAGVLGFVVSGAEIARLTATGFHVSTGLELITGRMGIDTATPRSALDVNGITSIHGAFEDCTIDGSAIAGTPALQLDYVTNALKIFDANATSNFSFNIRGDNVTTLDSIMGVNQVLTLVVEVPMGVTPYYCTGISVDGNAPSQIKWFGGAPTAGSASGINVYSVTVIKKAANTFYVRASLVQAS